MDAAAANALRSLRALDSVCCLECGQIYSKPAGGGTVNENPGCPDCGYVGWIPVSLPAEAPGPRRSAAGPRQPLSARSR